jgi:hypothetical protein
MGPALTAEELAGLYRHLEPCQRIELEQWYRGRRPEQYAPLAERTEAFLEGGA